MSLEHVTRPMCEMTEAELDALHTPTPSEIISQSWRRNYTNDFKDNNTIESYYFADLGTEMRDFLRKLLDYHEASKRLVRRTQAVVSELLLNAERHISQPFYICFKLSFRNDGSILVILVNSCTKENFIKAKSYVTQALEAKALGKERLDNLADKLLESPNKGGMGLWNTVTQLNGDFWVRFNPENNYLTSYCIIREK